MTYTALVGGSSPLGYWKLNGSGSAVIGTAATVSNASAYWTTPPLVANSGSALKIVSGGASVSMYDSSLNNFYKNYESKNFSIEFWFSFNACLDGSGYIKNSISDSRYYNDYKLKIIKIMNASVEIGSILYDYRSNTFRFSINGNENQDAYIPVRNLNNSFYIVAMYIDKTLKIMVNGEPGAMGFVNDTSLYPQKTSSSVTYVINGNSLNSTSSISYVIGDVAIYNYELTPSAQHERVLYALSPDKPISITNYLQTSYFDFVEKEYHIAYRDIVSSDRFADNFMYNNNTTFSKDMGIAYFNIQPLRPSNEFPTSSTTITSSGAIFSSSGSSLVFQEYGQFFEKQSFKVITCIFTPLNTNGGYLFSIPNSINFDETLYASVGMTGLSIGKHSSTYNVNTELYNISTSLSPSTSYEFGICIDKNDVATVFINDVGETFTIDGFDITTSSELIIGNLIESPLQNNFIIKNFGMSAERINNFSEHDFEDNNMLMAKLQIDKSISQMATWTKTIPLSQLDDNIVGSKITWDSMDNCSVEVSTDQGISWRIIKRGESIPNLNYSSTNKNALVRLMIPYEYSIETLNQSFSALHISIYSNLDFVSNDGLYYFKSMRDYSNLPSYTIKRLSQPITFRQEKPGIFFDKINNYANGYACVVPTSSVTNMYAIDFWVRPQSLGNNINYLFKIDGPTSYYAYVDPQNNKLIYSPSTSYLYINGSSVSSGSYTFIPGEYYHLFFNFSGSVANSASLYINSNSSSMNTHMHGSYAHLNIWNDPVSSSTAKLRYENFVSNNIVSIQDTNTLFWQSNWNSSSISSASAYIFG